MLAGSRLSIVPFLTHPPSGGPAPSLPQLGSDGVSVLRSQQRLLLIDAPLHNTFLELWTMVHFLIPGISRPYLHCPLRAPSEENQDYYHKVVIRLHRVRVAVGNGVSTETCAWPARARRRQLIEETGPRSFPGDAAIYFAENQERRGKATDEEVRARPQVSPFEPTEGLVRGRHPAARVSAGPCVLLVPLPGSGRAGGLQGAAPLWQGSASPGSSGPSPPCRSPPPPGGCVPGSQPRCDRAPVPTPAFTAPPCSDSVYRAHAGDMGLTGSSCQPCTGPRTAGFGPAVAAGRLHTAAPRPAGVCPRTPQCVPEACVPFPVCASGPSHKAVGRSSISARLLASSANAVSLSEPRTCAFSPRGGFAGSPSAYPMAGMLLPSSGPVRNRQVTRAQHGGADGLCDRRRASQVRRPGPVGGSTCGWDRAGPGRVSFCYSEQHTV